MPRPLRLAALALDPRAGAVDRNLAAALAGLTAAADAGARVIALPEMWPTSFTAEVDPGLVRAGEAAVEALGQAAAARGVVAVGSAYASRPGGGAPTNRAHVVGARAGAGSRGASPPTLGGYDKVHLFSPTAEHLVFQAGDEGPPVLDVGDVRLAPLVCYDLRFPELVRAPVRRGAELLVVVAQWPDTRAAAWRALVAGRAAEGQCFVLAANRRGTDEVGRRRLTLSFSGHTLVAAPDGGLRAEGRLVTDPDAADPALLLADIDLDEVRAMRRAVPVLRDERPDVYARLPRAAEPLE